MKIAFSKINSAPYPFNLNLDNVIFEGDMVRINPKHVKLKATMQGFVDRPCDRCGLDMKLKLDENIELLLSDGIFKDFKNELSDTIEFFDSQIDLAELAFGELEVHLSDYFYCDVCGKI
ncbi:hypothetical protein [Campylobacter sp.]|uniref:hypothetical protein n=1 Tax=Campylobacter sp. TaxID=205 RepID=UPI0026DD09FA|nr:hypothetical protein [Campylobacter sp.]MDO4673810.1 hypothetical protein [Campylobacter sp.]